MSASRALATSRLSVVAGGSGKGAPASARLEVRPETERYAYSHNELHKNGLPFSWLRTGAQRLVSVPLDLLPWRGPESRATFKNTPSLSAQSAVRRRARR